MFDPKEGEHAFLAASSSVSWKTCSISPWLSAVRNHIMPAPDEEYSDEGTRSHLHLERLVGLLPDQPEGSSDTMEEATARQGLDYFINEVGAGAIKSEQRVFYDRWVPRGFGTCDLHALRFSDKWVLHIGDYKAGVGVHVDVAESWQVRLYALGLVDYYAPFCDIDTVSMYIIQPRINNMRRQDMPVSELLEWAANDLTDACDQVFSNPVATPSDSACQFCDGAPLCPALYGAGAPPTEMMINFVRNGIAFENQFRGLDDEELAGLYAGFTASNKFQEELKKYVRSRLEAGDNLPRIRQGAAKRGRRQWENEKKADKFLRDQLRERKRKLTERFKLITPVEAEALLPGVSLDEQVIQPPGKPRILVDAEFNVPERAYVPGGGLEKLK